ncbi:NACHT domain-containing protein [Gordonia sp. DT101]|uniref:NACHT domain-containing protein n=1 Tax=Gordonia sp. DT101 TaxID=3416545 RepID=UPI003CF51CBD
MSKFDLYGALEDAYFSDNPSRGVHFLSSFLEKQVRLAACLVFSELDITQTHLRLPRSTGLGGYLNIMEQVAHYCRTEATNTEATMLCDALTLRFAESAADRTIKKYRDYLSHGGIEPSGTELQDALTYAKQENAEAIRIYIEQCGGVVWTDGLLRLGAGPSLYPLIIESSGDLAIFQSVADQCCTFHTLNRDRPAVEFDSPKDIIVGDISRYTSPPPSSVDRQGISLFRESIRKDLKGFRELHMDFSFQGSYSPFALEWARKTSGGHEYRTDKFRIDNNYKHEWRSPDGWASYTEFLKSIANWDVVVRRSLHRLAEINDDLRKVEADQFANLSTLKIPDSISTKFAVREFLGTSFDSSKDGQAVDIYDIIDESSHNSTGVPQVYFVRGEAGIGKTYNLFKASKDRATALCDTTSDKPLYLYISCSGLGLKRVEDIIDAAVVGTQNLDFNSVLALSRNGLLVLVIDGFDELVGGTGYGDAFQLLRPVLKQLGGSGTLLLSARSSYFANQYQKSLENAAQLDGLPAHHMILELQRWSRSDVELLFAENSHWSTYRQSLSDSDLALLGVPFFAQAFNDATSSPGAAVRFQSLRSTLIDSYLARETKKLESRGGQSPVSSRQLRSIFQEIAGLLYESSESSLDVDDFKLACESALELDGFNGPNQALGDRLTVLCGMSASADSSGSPLFSFQHDIFFEVMLADYLGKQYLSSLDGYTSMSGALERSPLGDATVASIVERYEEGLASFLSEPSVAKKDSNSTYALNLAALISAFILPTHSMPSTWYRDINFGSLDLTPLPQLGITLNDCHIDRLRFASEATGSITLSNCTVNHLESYGDSIAPMSPVVFEGNISVQEMSAVRGDGKIGTFESGVHRVLEELDRLGAQGVQRQLHEARDAEPSALELFAYDVLNGMSARGENSYIIKTKSQIPGDSAGRGMYRPNDPLWADLTRKLESTGVASTKQITASGTAKSVVAFRYTSTALCSRQSSEAKINDFWSELRSS